jgi:PII-like signaling protein
MIADGLTLGDVVCRRVQAAACRGVAVVQGTAGWGTDWATS